MDGPQRKPHGLSFNLSSSPAHTMKRYPSCVVFAVDVLVVPENKQPQARFACSPFRPVCTRLRLRATPALCSARGVCHSDQSCGIARESTTVMRIAHGMARTCLTRKTKSCYTPHHRQTGQQAAMSPLPREVTSYRVHTFFFFEVF